MKRESPRAGAKSHTHHNNLSFLFLQFPPSRAALYSTGVNGRGGGSLSPARGWCHKVSFPLAFRCQHRNVAVDLFRAVWAHLSPFRGGFKLVRVVLWSFLMGLEGFEQFASVSVEESCRHLELLMGL